MPEIFLKLLLKSISCAETALYNTYTQKVIPREEYFLNNLYFLLHRMCIILLYYCYYYTPFQVQTASLNCFYSFKLFETSFRFYNLNKRINEKSFVNDNNRLIFFFRQPSNDRRDCGKICLVENSKLNSEKLKIQCLKKSLILDGEGSVQSTHKNVLKITIKDSSKNIF